GDIGSTVDSRCSATVASGCGGRVLTVLVGPKVKRGFRSAVLHNHESVLKTTCVALGLSACPGAAQTARDMGEFFLSAASVTITRPVATGTTSPVHVMASAKSSLPISAIKIYIDHVERHFVQSASVDTHLSVAAGVHNFTAQAWDVAGTVIKKTI